MITLSELISSQTGVIRDEPRCKMYAFFIISVLILQVNSDTICDKCVCKYETKNNEDFQGEVVDCSYSAGLLEFNFALPNTIHALDLSSSNISSVHSAAVLRSTAMTELFLNSNTITEISTNAFELPQLRKLDLSDNLLEFIDKDVFKTIKKLEYLNLANNKFTTFSKLTFHSLSNLQEVILDNNEIGPSLQEVNLFDRSGFGLTQKIKKLSISGVRLNNVPDNFFVDAYDIRSLIIANNNITDVFELPFTLEYLDLSDNPIEEVESEDFNEVPALKELKLNNVAIKEIPEFVFSSLHSLVKLELERNINLTSFSKFAFGREVLDDADDFILESLSLRGSRLLTLDKELFQPFGQLIHLDLQGNPWKCDCNLVWVKDLKIPEKDYDHFRCATPKPFFNARVFDLKPKFFTCPPNKNHVGMVISVVAMCSLLACVSVWLFVCVSRRKTRGTLLREMYTPSTAYSVLPMTVNVNGF